MYTLFIGKPSNFKPYSHTKQQCAFVKHRHRHRPPHVLHGFHYKVLHEELAHHIQTHCCKLFSVAYNKKVYFKESIFLILCLALMALLTCRLAFGFPADPPQSTWLSASSADPAQVELVSQHSPSSST